MSAKFPFWQLSIMHFVLLNFSRCAQFDFKPRVTLNYFVSYCLWKTFFYCNSSKSKTNMDEDKKENFRMEIIKKRLGIRSDWIYRDEVYLPLMFRTCAVETVKSCISLFLLLANLRFSGGHCFGRNSLPTSYQHAQLKLLASFQ